MTKSPPPRVRGSLQHPPLHGTVTVSMIKSLEQQAVDLVLIEHDVCGSLQVLVPPVRRNTRAMQLLLVAFASTQEECAPRGTYMIPGWDLPWRCAAEIEVARALRSGEMETWELENYIKEVGEYD